MTLLGGETGGEGISGAGCVGNEAGCKGPAEFGAWPEAKALFNQRNIYGGAVTVVGDGHVDHYRRLSALQE